MPAHGGAGQRTESADRRRAERRRPRRVLRRPVDSMITAGRGGRPRVPGRLGRPELAGPVQRASGDVDGQHAGAQGPRALTATATRRSVHGQHSRVHPGRARVTAPDPRGRTGSPGSPVGGGRSPDRRAAPPDWRPPRARPRARLTSRPGAHRWFCRGQPARRRQAVSHRRSRQANGTSNPAPALHRAPGPARRDHTENSCPPSGSAPDRGPFRRASPTGKRRYAPTAG